MKKVRFFSFLSLLTAFSLRAFAQLPEPGSILVGASIGTINFSADKNSNVRTVTISGTPQVGFLLTRGLLIGLGVPVFHTEANTKGFTAVTAEFRTTQIGIAPFARYYVTPTRLRPYLTASAGQNWFRYKSTGTLPGLNEELNSDYFAYNAGVGLAYFFNRNVSFDVTGVYNGGDNPTFAVPGATLGSFTTPEAKTISVQFGLQIFL
ncbi:outer membrane beta-barrel protein [Tellurirhabdus rosea]|uniref:outer membrane beta-barrel protein n=1 Tax=Tellurirhabdus rosea TaxID=2674997 RepID=UPI00225AF172|nr:outer membrane beta-barrel protein [Tellurirhabdus rosea]